MRILFSSTSGEGHYFPLVPLAHAFQGLGHEVAFAMAPSYAERVESAGFSWFSCGIEADELFRGMMQPRPELEPLAPQVRVFVSRFALTDAPERLETLQGVVAPWSPDLLVSEPCDLAAPIAAAAAGVPRVLHAFGRPMPRRHYEASEEFISPLWESLGMPAAPLCGIYDGQYVDICPPSLLGDELPSGVPNVPLRPTAPGGRGAPSWLESMPNRPTVYVTLGTLFNEADRFQLVLGALAHLNCNVVATVGRDVDPAEIDPLPQNARVERFIPQHLLLPRVDVVVNHGGSGSMLGALSHGLPQLMLPMGADQFDNAKTCRERGVARSLPPDAVTTAAVEQEVDTLLRDRSYAEHAREVADEIARMPAPAEVARSLAPAE